MYENAWYTYRFLNIFVGSQYFSRIRPQSEKISQNGEAMLMRRAPNIVYVGNGLHTIVQY